MTCDLHVLYKTHQLLFTDWYFVYKYNEVLLEIHKHTVRGEWSGNLCSAHQSYNLEQCFNMWFPSSYLGLTVSAC